MATRTKLTVILHADVVGSTALVQKDERVAHERIQDTFHRFSETISAYGGLTHELRGDALVAEFDRASDAVCAALAFQAANRQYNEGLSADIRPEIRVGIALGEVIVANQTITGPGVVLAQRLEQLASPGGVVVQGAVNEAVPRRLPLDYEALGDQILKGFDEPVRAHTVRLSVGETVPAPDPRAPSVEPRTAHNQRRWVAGGVIALLIVVVALAWHQRRAPDHSPAPIEEVANPLPDKPSIAVLPFTNMSGDPKQEYFVDGMTEDLITDLSKLSGLFVIARNSSFAYKGKSPDVREVSRKLGVKYVLEGSVRRAEDQVRINAQLIDATTGGHLWAERYDGALRNVFSLQDEITAKIVAALAVQLTADEEVRQTQIQTDNPQAYEAFLRGWEHYRRDTADHYPKAMEYFEQAVELDPDYGRAYAGMASTYWKSFTDEFYNLFHIGRTEARERAQKLLEQALHNPSSLAYQAASEIGLWRHKHEEAISNAEKAIALDPNSADGRVVLAEALIFSGRPEEALDLIDSAEQLDPLGKARYEFARGLALFGMEQYDNAATSLERARELNPEDWASDDPIEARYCLLCQVLLATYGHLARTDDADSLLAYIRAQWPWGFTISYTVQDWPYKKAEDAERLDEGLRKAGVPE